MSAGLHCPLGAPTGRALLSRPGALRAPLPEQPCLSRHVCFTCFQAALRLRFRVQARSSGDTWPFFWGGHLGRLLWGDPVAPLGPPSSREASSSLWCLAVSPSLRVEPAGSPIPTAPETWGRQSHVRRPHPAITHGSPGQGRAGCPGRQWGHPWGLRLWSDLIRSLWLNCKIGKLKIDLFASSLFLKSMFSEGNNHFPLPASSLEQQMSEHG